MKILCEGSKESEGNSQRFISSTNLAEIVYTLREKEIAVFSVKFMKEQLSNKLQHIYIHIRVIIFVNCSVRRVR